MHSALPPSWMEKHTWKAYAESPSLRCQPSRRLVCSPFVECLRLSSVAERVVADCCLQGGQPTQLALQGHLGTHLRGGGVMEGKEDR